MTNPANDDTIVRFEIKEGEVWAHVEINIEAYNLGPTEQVMEAMCRFLAEQDFGE